MRSFLEHLTEAETPFEDRDICWYLSQPNERKLARALTYLEHGATQKVHPVVQPYIKAISKFYETTGTDKVWVSKIIEMAKCQNRAAWTTYTGGTIYRGIRRSWSELKNVVFTGKVSNDRVLAFEAKAAYVSKYPVQSWTNDWNIAIRFANNLGPAPTAEGKTVKVIYEGKVKPEDTLFNPAVSRKLSEYGMENEIIRISNNQIPVKVYVFADSFQKELLAVNSKEARMIRLQELVGKKNASILSGVWQMKDILQH